MTEQEVYKKIRPLLEGYGEGEYWDFKKTLNETADIIKDILAFSNSDYDGDSYIIVGVSEAKAPNENSKIPLTSDDRKRLNTDANYIYLPEKWDVHGLSSADLESIKQFSARLTEQLGSSMLLNIPRCEYIPISINKTRWLYVIVVKKLPGVFVSTKDIFASYDPKKCIVKQGVLYIRKADTTLGARTDVASATEHIRIWKKYIDWLEKSRG